MRHRTVTRTLRVATYNIHSWKGTDGVVAPQRAMAVITALDADMVALQEVASHNLIEAKCSLQEIAQELGYHVTFGPTMFRSDSRYGNALLSRQPPIDVKRHNLECLDREPRGALDVTFAYDDKLLRIITTHLGLKRWERMCQMKTLQTLLSEHNEDITFLMGDLNEWLPWGYVRRRVHTLFGATKALRTFPSRWPLLALDRIHIRPRSRLVSIKTKINACTQTASDHLPLVAEVNISD